MASTPGDPDAREPWGSGIEGSSSLRLLRSLDRVNRAIQATSDLERMMSDVLDVVLDVFEVDRAWMLHPCDPASPTWRVSMERTRPEWPGALAANTDFPTDPDVVTIFDACLASQAPFAFGEQGDAPMPRGPAEMFGVRSALAMALHPRGDKPFLFGLHQCSRARDWAPEDRQIFQEIGRRLGDGLTSLLAVRRLRESEAALRASEERLRAFFDTSNAGLVESDDSGRILRANMAFYTMLGHGRGEIACIGDCLFPEDVAAIRRRWSAIKRGLDTQFQGEQRLRRKDGTPLFTLARVGVLSRGGDGVPVSYSTVVIDMTERKRLEDHLQRAQKMEAVGRLAGGVAHDFNNLLTVINGHADLLLGDGSFTGDHKDSLLAIRDAGLRAARLTSQLLAFSRKAIVEPRVLDLNEVVEVTAKMLRRLLGEDITLRADLAADVHRVRADLGQIEQVIMNLAVNARDAMPTGGRLTIETDEIQIAVGERRDDDDVRPGHYVRLRVSDTGSGMTDDVRARIFEPFFTTKEMGHGTGLGLATVYGIVRQAGGFVFADSRLGHGTVFTVLLPAEPDSVQRSESARAGRRGTETILLVEDEDPVRKLTKRLLELHGYTVLDSGRPSEALRIADRHEGPIHLLLTDVVMPHLGGRDLAEALRARRPDVKVLFMSGFTADAVLRHGVSAATDALLQKPFTPISLTRKVRDVLDGLAPAPHVSVGND